MKKSPKYFTALLAVVVLVVVWYRYNQYFVKKNFLLFANTSCNPGMEQCFVLDCSPEDDPECDPSPYKKVEIIASKAPACLEEHSCQDFICENDAACVITYCSEDQVEEGEICFEEEKPEFENTEHE